MPALPLGRRSGGACGRSVLPGGCAMTDRPRTIDVVRVDPRIGGEVATTSTGAFAVRPLRRAVATPVAVGRILLAQLAQGAQDAARDTGPPPYLPSRSSRPARMSTTSSATRAAPRRPPRIANHQPPRRTSEQRAQELQLADDRADGRSGGLDKTSQRE